MDALNYAKIVSCFVCYRHKHLLIFLAFFTSPAPPSKDFQTKSHNYLFRFNFFFVSARRLSTLEIKSFILFLWLLCNFWCRCISLTFFLKPNDLITNNSHGRSHLWHVIYFILLLLVKFSFSFIHFTNWPIGQVDRVLDFKYLIYAPSTFIDWKKYVCF